MAHSQTEALRHSTLPFPGLANVGNSCYMSSVLQLLGAGGTLSVRHFSRNAGPIGRELVALLGALNATDGPRTLSPLRFIASFSHAAGFSPDQQDAHEFLLALLNLRCRRQDAGLRVVLQPREAFLSPTSPFCGVLVDEIVCLGCAMRRHKHVASLRIEPFSCISLCGHETCVSVEELVYRHFRVPERLSDYRSGTSCGVGAIRVKHLLRVPQLLLLHIPLLTTATYRKSTQLPVFSEHLIVPGFRYRLLAVIEHRGTQGHTGHFVCYRRGWRDGEWMLCDDAWVSVVAMERVLAAAPYILLYGLCEDGATV